MKKFIVLVIAMGLLGGVGIIKCGMDSAKPAEPEKVAQIVEPKIQKPVPHEGRAATEAEYSEFSSYGKQFAFSKASMKIEKFIALAASKVPEQFPDTKYEFHVTHLSYVYNIYQKGDSSHKLVACVAPLLDEHSTCLFAIDMTNGKGGMHLMKEVPVSTVSMLSAVGVNDLAKQCAKRYASVHKLAKAPDWEIRLVTHWEQLGENADLIMDDNRFQVVSVIVVNGVTTLALRTTYYYNQKGEVVGPAGATDFSDSDAKLNQEKLITR